MSLVMKMAQIEIKPDHHILILGKTGSGKSFATKHIFLPSLKRQDNQVLVILDSKREYGDITNNVVTTPQALNHFLYAEKKPKGKIVRILNAPPTERIAEEYLSAAYAPHHDIMTTDWRATFGVRFFIEDMPMFYDSPYKVPPQLKYWACMGRAAFPNCPRTLVGTYQRAQLIPKTVMTQCEHLFLFSLSEYDIVHSIIPIYGHSAGNKVATLEKYGYVLVSDLYDEPIKFKPYQPNFTVKSEKGIYLD